MNLLFRRKWWAAARKLLLLVAVIANLGVLCYFKYHDFFFENFKLVLGSDVLMKNLLLPLGISFFTFQQISYIIDCYRSKVAGYSLLDYSLFVTFFPQLTAGPIVLHSELVPQFTDQEKKRFSFENFAPGLMAFSVGLAKK